MKNLKKTMVIVAVAGGLAARSQAAFYDITFTGAGWSASGQIDVSGGVATSGNLDVTDVATATTIDYGFLATGSGIVKDNNGDNLPTGDNLVSLAATDPFDENGLLFVQIPINGNGNSPAGMYLSADQNNGFVPNLNGYGNAPAGFGFGNPNVDGTLTLLTAGTRVPVDHDLGGFCGDGDARSDCGAAEVCEGKLTLEVAPDPS